MLEDIEEADSVTGANQTPESVDELPPSSDFVLTPSLNLATLTPGAPPEPAPEGSPSTPFDAAEPAGPQMRPLF